MKSILLVLIAIIFLASGKHLSFRRKLSVEDVPFVSGILVGEDHVCTGALIHDDVVLTSSDCLTSKDPNEVKVYLGVSVLEPSVEHHHVAEIITMDSVEETETVDAAHLALIKLKKKVPMDDKIKLVPIETKPWPTGVEENSRSCLAMAFSKDPAGGDDITLHGGKVTVEHGSTACACAGISDDERARIICLNSLGYEGENMCYGNYGGPLICDDTIVGVAHQLMQCVPVDESEGGGGGEVGDTDNGEGNGKEKDSGIGEGTSGNDTVSSDENGGNTTSDGEADDGKNETRRLIRQSELCGKNDTVEIYLYLNSHSEWLTANLGTEVIADEGGDKVVASSSTTAKPKKSAAIIARDTSYTKLHFQILQIIFVTKFIHNVLSY